MPTGRFAAFSTQAGTANPTAAAHECVTCTDGEYQDETGQTACSVCGAGNFSANILSCEPCQAGTANAVTSANECVACADGSFQALEGQTACNVCGAGSYSANVLSCEPCQVGEYCPEGSVVGTRCPTGFTTDGRGAVSEAECGCFDGYYEVSAPDGNRTCVECSAGMQCAVPAIRLERLPLVPGYWRETNGSADVRKCFTAAACLGGANLTLEAFCAPSQQGPYCAVCRDGHYGGGDGVLCEPCGGSSVVTVLPAVIILFLLLLVLIYMAVSCYRGKDVFEFLGTASQHASDLLLAELQGDGVGEALARAAEDRVSEQWERQVARSAEERRAAAAKSKCPKLSGALMWLARKADGFGVKAKIIISLFQMLQGIGITFSIRWPDIYGNALRFIGSILQIDLPQAMPISCIYSVGFFGVLVVRTAVPLALILLLVLIGKAAGMCKSAHGHRSQVAAMCSSGWFILLFLVYPGCSSVVFQAFICDELDSGVQYLRVDYAITCWEGEHLRIVAYALVMALVYPLGTPLLYSAMLYANRATLAHLEELEAKAKWIDTDGLSKEGRSEFKKTLDGSIRSKYLAPGLLKLTNGFTARCYWFEVFECVRKICLVGLPIFLPIGSSAQLICGLLVCFVSFGMYASYAPHANQADSRLSKICQVSLFFSLVSSITLKMEEDESAEELGIVLLVLLAVPPVIAFFFQSDLDFEEGLGLSRLKAGLLACFHKTIGACLVWTLGSPPPLPAKSARADGGSTITTAKGGKVRV